MSVNVQAMWYVTELKLAILGLFKWCTLVVVAHILDNMGKI